MKNTLVIVIIAILLQSCAGTQNLMGEKNSVMNQKIQILDSAFLYNPNYQYKIKRDDKVNLSVWGQDELSVGSTYGIYNSNEVYGKYLMVDANGNIEVPKYGTMKIDGLTTIELKDSLKSIFSQWIVRPVVDIKILNKDITVMGEVENPGVYDVDKDFNNLFELLARSGGFKDYANLKYIKVFRQEGADVRVATINLKEYGEYFAQNIQLIPGDIVVIPTKKYKEFDTRISVMIPFTSAITSAAIFKSAFR
jgi:polysaccharide biosynthesis/export protein